MGLLDDAIREHLELKRLHGADAGEVARQEHEALGPVRREDIAVADPADASVAVPIEDELPAQVVVDHPGSEDPTLYVPPPTGGSVALGPPEPEPEPLAPEQHAPDPEPEAVASDLQPVPPAVPETEQHTVAFSLDELDEAASPPTPTAVESEATPADAAVPTQDLEWDAPAAPPAAEEPPPVAEDVVPADEEPADELEETPEFLQETPEHDRLWFEQKPPRDFDF